MNPRTQLTRISAIVALFIAACILYVELEKAHAMQSAPGPNDLQSALIRAGLDAKSLTAAGLSSQETTTLIANVQEHMAENSLALANADAAYGTAKIERDRLQRLIQSGTHSAQDLTAYATAASQFNTAETQRSDAIQDIWDAGTTDLSEAKQALLANMNANRDWEVPIEFTVISRTQEQWVQLREALAHERVANEGDSEVDPEIETLLGQLRGDTAVSAAAANLNANLQTVTTAWNAAIEG